MAPGQASGPAPPKRSPFSKPQSPDPSEDHMSKNIAPTASAAKSFTHQHNRIQYLQFWNNSKPNFKCGVGRSYDQMC
ncbi:hypothetical protein DUI87_17180 [Hirundo rustica rustica]|uniref:Uncharacterized protein n=1 Tax=Hirundo rustica rustica TaxID=333673 RepID=A0A3M0K3F2_HIRRU|nr:hypothetical protein DUI87_17180 [Hirundo rustica rustica]